LGEHRVTFKGQYNRIDVPSTVYPKPFGAPLRPWVAALKPGSAARVGREGNNLYGILNPMAADNFPRYLEAAQEAGHERSTANHLVTASVIVAPTDREAKVIQERATASALETMPARGLPEAEVQMYLPVFGGSMIVGSPETVLDQVASGMEMVGAGRLLLIMRLRSIPREAARQTRHLFAEEIMPKLRNLR
jgi:alkanesulfonate monooxygenase SsuD/methylene tetrahydromethanopterin reductase-like flavin-dependent oxidoreductase (luciferase family)